MIIGSGGAGIFQFCAGPAPPWKNACGRHGQSGLGLLRRAGGTSIIHQAGIHGAVGNLPSAGWLGGQTVDPLSRIIRNLAATTGLIHKGQFRKGTDPLIVPAMPC